MKSLFTLLFCCSLTFIAQAQKNAVTETGEEIVIYDNGTWKYLNEELNNEVKVEIPTNPKAFNKSKRSSFQIKSKILNVGVWLNPKTWSFKKAESNPAAEYELKLKNGDLYGMLITEKIEIPIESLKNIALENGKSAAPDLHIVHEEYRMVNGIKVLMMQMDGTTQGIKFSYLGYYYSSHSGTVQFITYTSQNLLKEYRNISEDLLNGFNEIQ